MSDKEWDVFKESVKPIRKEGTAKPIIKKLPREQLLIKPLKVLLT